MEQAKMRILVDADAVDFALINLCHEEVGAFFLPQ